MKISQKLILAFVFIILLVSFAGYFSIKVSQDTLIDAIGRKSTVLASEILNEIDKTIYYRIEEYKSYSKDMLLQQKLVESNKAFEQLENRESYIDQKDREWTSLPENQFNPFIEDLTNNSFSQQLKNRLQFYRNEYGYDLIGEIFVTNKYGANIAQSGRTSDYRQNDEQWWKEAKRNGLYISDVNYDKSADINSLDVCIRIDDDQGKFLGVIKVVLNIEEIFDILKTLEQGKAYIGNSYTESLKFKLINNNYEYIYATENNNDKIGSRLSDTFIDRIVRGDGKGVQFWIDKGEVAGESDELYTFARSQGFKDYYELDWLLLVRYETDEILKPVTSLRKIIIIILIVLAVLVVFVGAMIYYSIVVPMNELKEAAVKIGHGELDTVIYTNAKDEIGDLARSFLQMIVDLQKTTVSKNYVDNIIASMNDSLFLIDPAGRDILDVNPEACHTLGYTRDELLKMKVTDIDVKIKNKKDWENLLTKFKLGKSMVFESVVKRKDETSFPVEISARLTSDQTKKKAYLLAIMRNITNRKKMEEDLKISNQELLESERASRNMLLDLQRAHDEIKTTQTQLLQSEKLASIGQLAAGVAHEINNPVGFISNNVEVLEEYIEDYTKILQIIDGLKRSIEGNDLDRAKTILSELNDFEKEINLDYVMNDVNKLLDHSQRGIERIKKIVLDLRTFAREDKDALDLVKIEEVIDSIISIVYNELKYKAELKKNYGETPLVKCNSQRLGQVFINLLVNAIHAIEEKGEIEVKTYEKDGFICVAIKDTGKGIEAENLNKIFDAFYTTKPIGEGTGLGLSVSYEIIKKHGGDITVASKVGQGTIFTVKLPLNHPKS